MSSRRDVRQQPVFGFLSPKENAAPDSWRCIAGVGLEIAKPSRRRSRNSSDRFLGRSYVINSTKLHWFPFGTFPVCS
jgi:hypothetical protein